jgi:hypothetical protein
MNTTDDHRSIENPRPDLCLFALHEALNPGMRSLRIIEGLPLDLVSKTAYDQGWALLELNLNGVPVRAYRRDMRQEDRYRT